MNLRRALLALGLATSLSLGLSGVAYATSYDCDGGSNPVPTTTAGDVDIIATGACTIGHSVTAGGHIRILSSGTLTVTGTLTSGLNNGYEIDLNATDISVSGSLIAGGYIRAEGTADNVRVMGDVVANSADVTGNVLLIAQKNIGTGNIITSGSSTSGGVEIDPNQGGANTLFTIGGSGNANGVNGTIDTSTVTGGGTSATNVRGGIFISNGGSNSTGGITVTNGSDLNVSASNSRAGLIILDAKKGTLTISNGTLSAKGATNKQAGIISLLAQTIAFGSDITVDVSQDAGAAASYHTMTLAASSITYSGSSGLTLNADGDGNSSSQAANVRLMPTGGLTATSNRLVGTLSWSQSFPNTPWGTNAALSVSGASNSPLNISANGSYGAINVSGNGVTFAGGALTAEAMGANTAITIYYTDGLGTFGDFTVNNTGAVKFDASGIAAAGGTVLIYADDTQINNASTFTVAANGPASGNGDGGVIDFQTNTSVLDVLTKVKLTADAASAGTGNAVYADPTDSGNIVAITFYTGSTMFLDIGTDNGQFAFSANGGSAGGDAGAMRIITPSTVRVQTDDAINASALGGNGKGGWVWLSYIDAILDGYTAVILQGHGTGIGGRFVSGNFVFGSFDVNRNINVDGGSSLLTASENDYGYISLNDVVCQQRTSGQATWPQAYWNCANPSSSTSQDQVPVDLAKTSTFNGVRTLYTSNGVNLYIFPDNTAYNDFFNKNAPAVAGGVTSRQYAGGTITVAPWLTGAIGSNTVITYSANQLKEVTAHELGHASDISHGESNDSQSTLFDSYVSRDFNTLDYADSSFTIRRLPCMRTVDPAHPLPTDPLHFFPGAAPFAGTTWLLPDNSTAPICVTDPMTGDLVLNPVVSTNPAIMNHEVMEIIESYYWAPADPWIEAHAQAFGYAAVGNLGATPNSDQIFDKGYFPCIVSWGNAERSGSVPSGACSLSPL